MTLSVPSQRTWSVSDIVTAAEMNANVRDAVNFLVSPPTFEGNQATGQSIPNAAYTDVAIDTNDIDTYSGHSTSVNNARYTSQVRGVYLVFGKATFSANGTGKRDAGIARNGVLLNQTIAEVAAATAAGSTTSVITSPYYITMFVGDYVTLQAYQSSTAALSLLGGGYSNLTVRWIHS